MSDNGKDDAKDKTVNFDSLELDGDEESSQKLTALLAHLKENMEPEKYAEAMTLLGVKTDLSNAELLEAFKQLVAPKKPEEEEEEEDPEKKAAVAEEGEKPDRGAFMKECMAKDGMDLATCTEEFKKKYPEPAKDEGAKPQELSDEVKDQLRTLTDQVTELTKEKELGEIATDVEKLVAEKHLAPVQREAIINMSAKMDEAERTEFFNFFRATQKLNVHRDAGVVTSLKPGEVAGNDLSTERKKELIELHGLGGLIMDKGDRSRPWAKELNN